MTSVAIIISCIEERHEALRNSIYTWGVAGQYAGVDYDIYVTAEGYRSPPDTKWPKSMWVHKHYTNRSGSHIAGYNYWFKEVPDADVYIFTHPDMLVPKDTIKVAVERAQDNVYVTFKCFWIPPDMTMRLKDYNWKQPETLEAELDLYAMDDFLKGSFYANGNARKISVWESSTTHAVNNFTAHRMYPFPDLGHQGWDDPYQVALRTLLGIRTDTVMNPILFHQWHANTRNDQEGQAVREALEQLDIYKREHKL